MKPTPIHRFYFSQDEVIAALFPSGIPSKTRELRMDGDELIVDFVDPAIVTMADQTPAQDEDDDFPGDRPLHNESQRHQDGRRKIGDNELEADHLCAQKLFQTFLEVKTEEAARRVLLDRTRARDFSEFDTVKSWKANFRDVIGEFELWKRG